MIVCVDDFSKFVLLDTLPQLSSGEVRKWLQKNILFVYGKPNQIRTDHGSEFKGKVEEWCTAYRITHITTPPFAPWRNGRAERMIRFVKSLLRRLRVEDNSLDWTEWLP